MCRLALLEGKGLTRVFTIGQTKRQVNDANKAPSPNNKRGADQQERTKIEVVKEVQAIHVGNVNINLKT